jgi:uncharacterized protein YlxP (DUF503 family)
MFIGVARLVLQIPGARSLKERRRVVKSLKDRLRARLPVSVAEVGDVERYQVATLGLAVISRDAPRCQEVLSSAASLAAGSHGAVLADVATELVPFGAGGGSLRAGIERAIELEPSAIAGEGVGERRGMPRGEDE